MVYFWDCAICRSQLDRRANTIFVSYIMMAIDCSLSSQQGARCRVGTSTHTMGTLKPSKVLIQPRQASTGSQDQYSRRASAQPELEYGSCHCLSYRPACRTHRIICASRETTDKPETGRHSRVQKVSLTARLVDHYLSLLGGWLGRLHRVPSVCFPQARGHPLCRKRSGWRSMILLPET